MVAAVGQSENRDLALDRRERGQAFQPGHGMVDRLTMAQSTGAMRRWGPPVIVTLAAMAALTALTAGAAARQARPAPPTEATAPRGDAPLRDGQVALGAHLRRVENLGSEFILHFDVTGIGDRVIMCRVPADHDPGGGHAEVVFDVAACHLFDAEGLRTEPLGVRRDDRNERVRLYLGSGDVRE